MPIRMVDDDNQQQDFIPSNDNSGGGGSRGGGNAGSGCLTAFLPIILRFVFKKPLIAIPLLLVGAFFLYQGGFIGGGQTSSTSSSSANQLATGAELNPQEYDKAEVAAALSEYEKNPLPEMVSLLQYAPARGNQGEQGSCVGWGSSYAARTILEASSTGQNPDDIAMSPSFVYNQIGNSECQGAIIPNAMKVLSQYGDVPLRNFAYTDKSCQREPDQQAMQLAQNYKIRGFERLSKDGDDLETDFFAIKQYLAKGAPVVCGMMVGGSFMQDMIGKKIWKPTQDDYSMEGFGGHCMCIIGYDDRMQAFQIMNSWGPDWGEDGVAWVGYKDFMHFNKEAYALQPLPKRGEMAARKFECAIGLVNNDTKQYIPLSNNGNVFTSTQTVAKGTKFKIELQNSVECYVYIFGQETDGSSYVLFPYTPKHTAFCGITGYRLFPKNQSLQVDNLGSKDLMAIVTTKEPLDYAKLNASINAAQGDYRSKVMSALQGQVVTNVQYTSDKGRIGFVAESETKAVVSIVEINK